MSDDALTMRGPVHGTKDAKRVAIGSSVGAVIETYDFIFRTAAALYFGHAFLPGASPIARTLASFATLGVWGNPDTLVNNAAIITINDLEPPASRIFPASCNSGGDLHPTGGGTARRRPHPAPSCCPASTRRPATLTGRRGDGDRPIPNPPHSARPGHQRMTPRPAAQPRTECRCPGRFPDQQPGAAMTTRSRHRAAPSGPRHTDTAAPPCAAAASPLTMTSEYLVDNRSVPS